MRRSVKILSILFLGVSMIAGVILLFSSGASAARAGADPATVIQKGLANLKAQQQKDGGMTGFSGTSDPDTTARAVMAFATAKVALSDITSTEEASMVDYLAAQAITFTHDTTGTLFPGRAGELLAAVSAAGGDPSSFGGMNLAGELEGSYHADSGAYSTAAKSQFSSGEASDLSQAWAILGLSLAGKKIPEAATQHLVSSQAADGSWGSGDPDTTALAVTALLASNNLTNQSEAIVKAIQYFHGAQLPNGGWRPSWDTEPLNADSTGWIIQALVAAGEDLRGQSWMLDGANPLDALMSLQKEDGSIGGSYANAYSTAEAILGLSGIPLENVGIAAAINQAGLVVYYGGDQIYTTCVSFTQTSISGLDLLKASGLAVQSATNPSQGTAVCKIGEVGSPSSECFGSMPNYWSYWVMGANGWEYSASGAEQTQVTNGNVNGWSWGEGSPPPSITFQNTCQGVAFVLPTSTETPIAATVTPEATSTVSAATPTGLAQQPTPTASGSQTSMQTYIIYGAILLVLAVVILVLFRSRSRG